MRSINLFLAMLLLSSTLFVACGGGGGTRGTGTAKVEGTVAENSATSNAPVPDVIVSGEMIALDGSIVDAANDLTDSEGKFFLEFENTTAKSNSRSKLS